MLGVDAVDAILFGGSAEGVEATFNSPSKVNNRYRPYERKVDAAKEVASARARADGSARRHSKFTDPPLYLEPLQSWAVVAWHCREPDEGWAAAFKSLVPAARTKFFAHSYERCGVADVKRPAAQMLFEGLHHLDRIPHGAPSTNASALAHHVHAYHAKLPERLCVVRPGSEARHLPPSLGARLLAADLAVLAVAPDGAPLASTVVPLTPALCSLYKAALGLEAAAQCPESASVQPDWAVLCSPRERWARTSADTWARVGLALDASASAAGARGAEGLLLGLLPQMLGATLPLDSAAVLAPAAAAAAAAAAAPAIAAAPASAATAGSGASVPAVTPAAAAAAPVASGGKGTGAEEADKSMP